MTPQMTHHDFFFRIAFTFAKYLEGPTTLDKFWSLRFELCVHAIFQLRICFNLLAEIKNKNFIRQSFIKSNMLPLKARGEVSWKLLDMKVKWSRKSWRDKTTFSSIISLVYIIECKGMSHLKAITILHSEWYPKNVKTMGLFYRKTDLFHKNFSDQKPLKVWI